jgi:hypothetical protein
LAPIEVSIFLELTVAPRHRLFGRESGRRCGRHAGRGKPSMLLLVRIVNAAGGRYDRGAR